MCLHYDRLFAVLSDGWYQPSLQKIPAIT